MKYIGIDCGTHTGIAIWDSDESRFILVGTMHIWQALDLCRRYAGNEKITVHFEDARQRKWLPAEASNSAYRGRLMGAGSVKRDAVIWEEFCSDSGIPFRAVPPQKGLTKWSPEQFEKVTGWKGRTSNHARDAALLVYGL